MRYECRPYDENRYATNLRLDNMTEQLMWDSAKGQDSLIVQTAYGENAALLLKTVCAELSHVGSMPDKYIGIMKNTWVRYVTAAEKARNRGCSLNGEGSSYAVFACFRRDDICEIYEPLEHVMVQFRLDIPVRTHVDVARQTVKRGFFKKREESTGYYMISFQKNLEKGYVDGSLSCKLGRLKFPVTGEMIQRGTVYMKTQTAPEIVSENRGIQLN